MPKKKTGRPAGAKTIQKYIDAGLDPEHPDVRVHYHRYKKQQEKADRQADKPAPQTTHDRRISRSEVMAPKFKADAKLQEWAAEIDSLVELQKKQRVSRRKTHAKAHDLFKQFVEAKEDEQIYRERLEATQKRLAVLRDLARRRRASMTARQYNVEANDIRKKLGLPKINVIANSPE